jgi:hypothetical protein
MDKSKVAKSSLVMANLWKDADNAGVLIKSRITKLTSNRFTSKSSENKRIYIKNNNGYVSMDSNILKNLSVSERNFIIENIIPDLKMNNALWFFDYRIKKGREERIIALLRKNNVLFKTDIIGQVHIVNPFLIRKGEIPTIIVATYHQIYSKNELTKAMCSLVLKMPKEAELSKFLDLKSDPGNLL